MIGRDENETELGLHLALPISVPVPPEAGFEPWTLTTSGSLLNVFARIGDIARPASASPNAHRTHPREMARRTALLLSNRRRVRLARVAPGGAGSKNLA